MAATPRESAYFFIDGALLSFYKKDRGRIKIFPHIIGGAGVARIKMG
jgi:hypothetical protein